jgi:ABC-type glutathione transport system ATPase component
MTALLDIREVGIRYGPGQPLRLDDFSCRLKPAESLVLVGESGAGKSTVLAVVSGFLAPTTGKITVLGLDPYAGASPQRKVQRNLGQVRQQPRASLDPAQTALEAVSEVLRHLRGESAEIALEKARTALTDCGVEPTLHSRRPSALSGGECQRVAVARALAHNPQLLVADEPTAALDPIVARETLDVLLKRLAKHGTGLLYVTHNLHEPERIKGQIGVLLGGKMVEWENSFASWDSMSHPYSQYLARSRNEPVPPLKLATTGCPFRHSCPRQDEKCTEAPPAKTTSPGHTTRCWHW